MAITGMVEAVIAVRLSLPPGTTQEQAAKMLSNGGVNLPLGLVQFVRKIDVAVVALDEPFVAMPPESLPGIKML